MESNRNSFRPNRLISLNETPDKKEVVGAEPKIEDKYKSDLDALAQAQNDPVKLAETLGSALKNLEGKSTANSQAFLDNSETELRTLLTSIGEDPKNIDKKVAAFKKEVIGKEDETSVQKELKEAEDKQRSEKLAKLQETARTEQKAIYENNLAKNDQRQSAVEAQIPVWEGKIKEDEGLVDDKENAVDDAKDALSALRSEYGLPKKLDGMTDEAIKGDIRTNILKKDPNWTTDNSTQAQDTILANRLQLLKEKMSAVTSAEEELAKAQETVKNDKTSLEGWEKELASAKDERKMYEKSNQDNLKSIAAGDYLDIASGQYLNELATEQAKADISEIAPIVDKYTQMAVSEISRISKEVVSTKLKDYREDLEDRAEAQDKLITKKQRELEKTADKKLTELERKQKDLGMQNLEQISVENNPARIEAAIRRSIEGGVRSQKSETELRDRIGLDGSLKTIDDVVKDLVDKRYISYESVLSEYKKASNALTDDTELQTFQGQKIETQTLIGKIDEASSKIS